MRDNYISLYEIPDNKTTKCLLFITSLLIFSLGFLIGNDLPIYPTRFCNCT